MVAHTARIMAWVLSLAGLCTLIAAGSGCASSQQLQRFEFTRVSMGVPARIVLYSNNSDDAFAAAAIGFDRIAQLDDCMSDYRPQSELMRLCSQPAGHMVPVSQDLFRILVQACEISHASGGAFDVTVGPIVKLWRACRKLRRLPTNSELLQIRELVGHRFIEFDQRERRLRLTHNGMLLDLGGIAKGYAAQQALLSIRRLGHTRCLVAMAGDIAAGDPPPGKIGWEIDTDFPDSPDSSKNHSSSSRRLLLCNASVSTSGDSQQFIEIAGVRYSHLLDPRTGIGTTNRVFCTVVSADGAEADGLSSAASVMGADAAMRMFDHYPHTAAIIWTAETENAPPHLLDPSGLLRFVEKHSR